jgi:ribose transport system ATP-binding protein
MVMLALVHADMEAGAKVIVLDEPTASLPVKDADRFLEAVTTAASQGVGILLVTHRLSEIFRIAQSVTVLRDGRVVLDSPVAQLTHERLVREIVGERDDRAVPGGIRRSERFGPRAPAAGGGPRDVLEVRGLGGELLDDVSFTIEAGEVLGVTGIGGSGAEELGGLIAGAITPRRGEIVVDGTPVPPTAGPRQCIAAGIAYVPADRLREGGIAALSARDNVALPSFDRYWWRRDSELADVAEVIRAFGVRPPEAARTFRTFSGGNQQKLIVGKWALTRPRVFVLDDPTSGVDPGAREDLFAVLRGLTDRGTAVLLISTEPEQLARVARRVLVIHSGAIAAELTGADLTEEAISTASII